MIKSDAQLERTLAQIEGFRKSMEALAADASQSDVMKGLALSSFEGMVAKLEYEVKEYRELKEGIVRIPPIYSIRDLGPHLMKFRIALGMTQERLAEMIEVSRQTINKYEEQEFQCVSVDVISQVMNALGIVIRVNISHQHLDVKEPELALA